MNKNKTSSKQVEHYESKLRFEIDSWDLSEALKRGDRIIIIDARSFEAYENEHIPGAISFPHKKMDEESIQKSLDYEIEYVTYCDGIGCSGSTKAALKLALLGYKVKELIGGIDWWKRDQHPTIIEKSCKKRRGCGCE